MYRKPNWKVFCNLTTGKKSWKSSHLQNFINSIFKYPSKRFLYIEVPFFYGRSLKVPLATEIFVNVFFSIKYPLKSPFSTEDHFRVAFKWKNFRKDHKIHFKIWNFLCIVLWKIFNEYPWKCFICLFSIGYPFSFF